MMRMFLICFVSCSFTLFAADENYEFDDPAKRKVFLELTTELRCPMCQNQNIADSDAMIARDLRRKVYLMVKEGKSREEVVSFMKARYGDFVSYQPPVTPVTMWLWLLPCLFVLGGIFVLFKRHQSPQVEWDESKLAEAEKLLAETEQTSEKTANSQVKKHE